MVRLIPRGQDREKTAGLLLDSRPQMRCFGAKESELTLTKYVKIGEHEQGR
jgi:hypothetical protein